MKNKIIKIASKMIHLFFMCCNLISVIGFSVKLGIGTGNTTIQWVYAVIALLTGMAFLNMLKTYLNNHNHLNQ